MEEEIEIYGFGQKRKKKEKIPHANVISKGTKKGEHQEYVSRHSGKLVKTMSEVMGLTEDQKLAEWRMPIGDTQTTLSIGSDINTVNPDGSFNVVNGRPLESIDVKYNYSDGGKPEKHKIKSISDKQ